MRKLIALVILALVCPAQAQYSGGSGTGEDPYQIATAADLILLGETPEDYDKHFILTADIDLDPNLPGRKVFDKAVIAPDLNDTYATYQGTDFTGVFDGNNHTISHLTITGWNHLGLFGQLGSGANVSNLGVEAVDIGGNHSIGGLAGSLGDGDRYRRDGILNNCYSTGTVKGYGRVGGLVGSNYDGSITACYSTGTVSGDSGGVGGLVGFNFGGGRITTCYSASTVHGDGGAGGLVGSSYDGSITTSYSSGAVTGHSSVGGFVGTNGSSIISCYSASTVHGDWYVGGFVGSNSTNGSVTTCYSTGSVSGRESEVGGFVGPRNRGSLHGSIWDMETSGLIVSDGGVGLTTAEMMDPHMLGLNGFANDPNWVLDAGRDYPRLAWEGTAGQIIPEPIVDWLKGQGTEEAPYRVDTAEQLLLLGKASILWDEHFMLGADIDLDPSLPNRHILGQALIQIFTGVFDGDGHAISHLTIKGGGYLGLFGQLESTAEVKNLGVVDANITGSRNRVGSLAGDNAGSIAMSYGTGIITGESCFVGGLVGDNCGSITTGRSTSTVTGCEDVGGIAGQNHGSIANSYNTGTVTGWCDSIGGLVGQNNGSITTSYNAGTVNGRHDGGLVQIGGSDSVSRSFWDTETSGQTTSAGGSGLSTAEMQTASTFLDAGWDFVGETANGTNDIWWIEEGQGYPRLWWELDQEN
jgi:hypothetical protein